jgi:membrane protease YdiL (CAAX protease family)
MGDPAVTDSTGSTPAAESTGRAGVAAAAWFFVLAYGFSWVWLVPIVLTGGVVVAGRGWPTHFPALLGPLIAAVVVTARCQGPVGIADLARRMVRLRVPARWWLFALSPVLLLGVVLVIDMAAGQPLPAYGAFAVFSGLPSRWGSAVVAAAILFVNGFGEETGWRGYALPALQRRFSPLVATVIISVLWAGWHAPMFIVVASFRSFSPAILVGWVIGLFCGAVVLTWLYNRSGGSILLVAVWHATYNIVSGTAAADGLLAATSTTAVIMLAVALLGAEFRARRRGRGSVLGVAEAGTAMVRPDLSGGLR